MIAIIDYGMGNLRSIENKLQRIDTEVKITSDKEEIEKADKLILPGVGFFASGMKNLNESGLTTILNKKVIGEKTPILGICLGMQLFSSFSQEGNVEGLKWIDAKTYKFKFNDDNNGLKIPHMGWNSVAYYKKGQLFDGIDIIDNKFYFVHSYYVHCKDNENVLGVTNYGHNFASAVIKENIVGTQFHPEKSHKDGMQILKNFSEKF